MGAVTDDLMVELDSPTLARLSTTSSLDRPADSGSGRVVTDAEGASIRVDDGRGVVERDG